MLRQDPPTGEMKIRLLYDIAQEFSIEWDDKAFRQSLNTQSSLCEVSLRIDLFPTEHLFQHMYEFQLLTKLNNNLGLIVMSVSPFVTFSF